MLTMDDAEGSQDGLEGDAMPSGGLSITRRHVLCLAACLGPAALLAACQTSGSSSAIGSGLSTSERDRSAVPTPAGTLAAESQPLGPVQVLYAGSLTTLMESALGPAFKQATGYEFQGEGKGS